MKTPPAFQFYADDFIGGTVDMTAEEVGAYLRLLCLQWNRGGVENDIKRLCLITGSNEPTTKRVLRCKFKLESDGMFRNERLEIVRREAIEWRDKSSKGGQVSGNKRLGNSEWGKKMAEQRTTQRTNNEPPNEPITNTPSPSPSPSGTLSVELPEGFPKTESEAAMLADMVMVPRDFAITTWNLAMGRGGRDSHDVPIRNFKRHVKASHDFQKNRESEQAYRGNGRPAVDRPLTDDEKISEAIR